MAPPPANVRDDALATATTTPDKEAFTVPVVLLQTVPLVPFIVQVPVPMLTVVVEPDIVNVKHVTAKVTAVNVPIVCVNAPAVEKASTSVYVPEGAEIVTA